MSGKRIRTEMLTQMSKQSLKYSRMRNTFVMITIALASALLMAILMYAAGQKEIRKDSFPTRSKWAIIICRPVRQKR